MAVRIKKLAKELNRSVSDVIGVLHALGYSRYRSPEDLLANDAEQRVRQGLRKGVPFAPVPVAQPSVGAPAASREDDLMARLVPGVVRAGGTGGAGTPSRPRRSPDPARVADVERPPMEAPRARPEPEPEPEPRAKGPPQTGFAADVEWRAVQAERSAVESLRRGLASERAVLAAERAELDDDRRRYDAQLRALDGEREALDALETALEAERTALDAERGALRLRLERTEARGGTSLQDLLEERGLRGADEFERAIESLAHGRQLRDVLWTLRVEEPEALRRVLQERLLLVDGVPADVVARSSATVIVASERAEVPGAGATQRLLQGMSEALLLAGLRRIALIGGRPMWHRVLREGLDPRIEVRAVAARVRDEAQAKADAVGVDLVLLWALELAPAARAAYLASRPTVIEVAEPGFLELVRGVMSSLAD